MILICSFNVFVATAGYLCFGDYVNADLLKSLPSNDYTTAARAGMGLCLVTCYPLQMHPVKKAMSNILFSTKLLDCNQRTYFSVVFIMTLVVYVIALLIDDLSTVFTFIGATSSMFTGYTFPAYFYIQIFKKSGCNLEIILAYTIFVCSLMLIPVLVTFELYSLFP